MHLAMSNLFIQKTYLLFLKTVYAIWHRHVSFDFVELKSLTPPNSDKILKLNVPTCILEISLNIAS